MSEKSPNFEGVQEKGLFQKSKEAAIAATLMLALGAASCVEKVRHLTSSELNEFLKKHPEAERIEPDKSKNMLEVLQEAHGMGKEMDDPLYEAEDRKVELSEDPNDVYYATIMDDELTITHQMDGEGAYKTGAVTVYKLEKFANGNYNIRLVNGGLAGEGKGTTVVEAIIDADTGLVLSAAEGAKSHSTIVYEDPTNDKGELYYNRTDNYPVGLGQSLATRGSIELGDLQKKIRKN